MVKTLVKSNDLFILTILIRNMGFKCFTHIFVLVFGHTVRDGVVSDVTNVLSVLCHFLNQVMLTSVVNRVVAGNLVRETLALNCLKLKCLNLLVD